MAWQRRFGFHAITGACVCALSLLAAEGSAAAAEPPSVSVGPTATPPVTPAPGAATAPEPGSDVRRGLVAIERDGRIAGVGVVLANDGRVLTSLSAVAGDDVTVKLPDGRNMRARVGHRDKSTDLALLIFQNGQKKWAEGLRASEVDPSKVELRAVVTASTQGGRATAVPVTMRGRVDVRSKDGQSPLGGSLDIELPKGANPLAGAPLLDDKGSVMGIFVRVCRPPPAVNAFAPSPAPRMLPDGGAPAPKCTPGWAGAPVSWVRSFLMKTPIDAVAPSPWLGIAGEPGTVGSTSGVRVLAVAPASPADKSGLKGSSDRAKAHMIVAVDGVPVSTPEKLAETIGRHAVGEVVKLLVLEGEKLREISVTLKAAP